MPPRPSLHRHWSGHLVDKADRAQSRAMLHAVGFERSLLRRRGRGTLVHRRHTAPPLSQFPNPSS